MKQLGLGYWVQGGLYYLRAYGELANGTVFTRAASSGSQLPAITGGRASLSAKSYPAAEFPLPQGRPPRARRQSHDTVANVVADRGKRDLGNLDQSQLETLGMSKLQVVSKYLGLMTDFNKEYAPGTFRDYDRLARDVLFACEEAGRSEEDCQAVRRALRNSESFGQKMQWAREVAVGMDADLAPYIDRAVTAVIEQARGPISEGLPPQPYYREAELLVSDARILKKAADVLAATDAQIARDVKATEEIRDFYGKSNYASFQGTHFRESPELYSLSRGEITFVGPDALNNALKYAPRASHVRTVLGPFPFSITHFGPPDAVDDKFSPTYIRYENSAFQHSLFSFDEDRYQTVLIYGNEYSLANSWVWQTNPFPTNDRLERAKLEGSRRLIQEAREAFDRS